jgi:exosome complex component RRP42
MPKRKEMKNKMMDVSRVVSSLERNYVTKLLNQGKRIDGRGLLEYREIKIISNFIPKAEGSADVRIGDTRVMCGVKYDIGKPFSDNPDQGVCTVMSEFVPIASPLFETGPPKEDSVQLARVVDRGIRHTNCLNYQDLCIKAGEAVYILFVDNYSMDYFGNLIDTAAIAAITALLGASIPGAKMENDKVVWDGTHKPLKIAEIPISITFGKIGDKIFVDPSLAEELILDGAISFACDEKGQITSIQKYKAATWTIEQVMKCAKDAIVLADGLRKKLNLRQYTPKPR